MIPRRDFHSDKILFRTSAAEEGNVTRMDEKLQIDEKSRQLVPNDLLTMKENIRQLELDSCSGSTAVGNGTNGTFTRPPPRIGQNDAIRSLSRWTPRCFGLVIPGSSIPSVCSVNSMTHILAQDSFVGQVCERFVAL